MRSPKENFIYNYMREKNENEKMTQEEVAKSFGVTRNYIQQVEKRAIEKLLAELKRRGIKKQDLLGD